MSKQHVRNGARGKEMRQRRAAKPRVPNQVWVWDNQREVLAIPGTRLVGHWERWA